MNSELYMMNIMPAPAAAGQTLLRTLNKQIVFPTTYLLIYLPFNPSPLLVLLGFEEDQLFGLCVYD